MKKGDLVYVALNVVDYGIDGLMIQKDLWVTGIIVKEYPFQHLYKIYVPTMGQTEKFFANQVKKYDLFDNKP
tara:strand:- start:179 stop:394 length:216 start_codon:yes stop_codon:yes gene_type:complete